MLKTDSVATRMRAPAATWRGWRRAAVRVCQVVVGKHAQGRSGQTRGIDEAGVGKLVEHDEVRFADDGGNHAERGGEAGGEDERGFGLFRLGERFFQQPMRRQRAADEPRGGGTGAELPHALDRARPRSPGGGQGRGSRWRRSSRVRVRRATPAGRSGESSGFKSAQQSLGREFPQFLGGAGHGSGTGDRDVRAPSGAVWWSRSRCWACWT